MPSINWLALNWIDYTIIGVILVSLLIGLVRGLICEVISLITWIAAFVLAIEFAHPASAHLTFDASVTTKYVIAFAGIFILTLVIGISINALVRHLWHKTGVPVLDRLFGLLLGVARGVVIVAFILLFVDASPLKTEPVVKASQLIPLFNPVIKWLKGVLPEKVLHISEWTKDKDKSNQNNNNGAP